MQAGGDVGESFEELRIKGDVTVVAIACGAFVTAAGGVVLGPALPKLRLSPVML